MPLHCTAIGNVLMPWESEAEPTREEFDDHVRCAVIPIFDRNNHVCVGLSASFPSLRYEMARELQLVAMRRDANRDNSQQLGCTQLPLDAAAGPR